MSSGPHRQVAARWLLFFAVIASFAALDQVANSWVNLRFATLTAAVTASLLGALGAVAQTDGPMIYSSFCSFEVIGECTAYYPCAIFIGAVAAYPCGWRAKLAGIGFGIPSLLLINQGRLVSLCYVARHYPVEFEVVHLLVWQSLIIFFTALLWIVWASVLSRSREARAA